MNKLEDVGDACRGFVDWAKRIGQGQMLEEGDGGMSFRRPWCDSCLHLKDMGTLENFLPGQVLGLEGAVQGVLEQGGARTEARRQAGGSLRGR